MAIANGIKITDSKLSYYLDKQIITGEEHTAIKNLDFGCGKKDDIQILNNLAKRLGVKLCQKK